MCLFDHCVVHILLWIDFYANCQIVLHNWYWYSDIHMHAYNWEIVLPMSKKIVQESKMIKLEQKA